MMTARDDTKLLTQKKSQRNIVTPRDNALMSIDLNRD
jgi:hypothetical protein